MFLGKTHAGLLKGQESKIGQEELDLKSEYGDMGWSVAMFRREYLVRPGERGVEPR
jgi:hypothetical protein